MKYICEVCGEECGDNPKWTDEKAKEEYKQNFPEDPNMEVPWAIICDNCYKKMGFELDD